MGPDSTSHSIHIAAHGCTCTCMYLLHSRGSSEEEVPLRVGDLASLSHDLSTEHEGEHQLVLLKQASAVKEQISLHADTTRMYIHVHVTTQGRAIGSTQSNSEKKELPSGLEHAISSLRGWHSTH